MGKIPSELRETIARNIRECRLQKFPGRGGGKKCAEAFGVSPQQWSPWERGMRTPDELRLAQIAEFFDVTVEDLRRDGRKPPPDKPPTNFNEECLSPSGIGQALAGIGIPTGSIPGIDIPPSPTWQPEPPGSAASFFWLAKHMVTWLQTNGIRIDKQTLNYLAELLNRPPP